MTHLGRGQRVETTKLCNLKIHISLDWEENNREKQRLTLLHKSNCHAKCSLLHPLPSLSRHAAQRPTDCCFLQSGLADPGLRHKLVLEVLDGEAFFCRALLDASTWTDGHTERPSALTTCLSPRASVLAWC